MGGGDVPGGGGPIVDTTKKNKRSKISLPWDTDSFYAERVPERDDEEDENEGESNYATLKRLKAADERTKNMTKDEYVHWSDCRQASFTFRKGKRFREWAGFGVVTDSKPNDDIIDILGFLTFEMVQTLTEEALRVKAEEDVYKSKTGGDDTSKKRKRETGLFDPPEEGNAPVNEHHIREAYRRLQNKANKPRASLGPNRALQRTRIQLVRSATLLKKKGLTRVRSERLKTQPHRHARPCLRLQMAWLLLRSPPSHRDHRHRHRPQPEG